MLATAASRLGDCGGALVDASLLLRQWRCATGLNGARRPTSMESGSLRPKLPEFMSLRPRSTVKGAAAKIDGFQGAAAKATRAGAVEEFRVLHSHS